MPPRPKPTALKVLHGTRKDRINSDEPVPGDAENIDTPPAWLPAEGKTLWRRLAPALASKKVLTSWDLEGLGVYCMASFVHDQAAADVAQRGVLVKGAKGTVKNPSLQIMRDSAATMRGWAGEFGLTPSARTSIKVAPDAEPRGAKRLLS